MDAAATAEHREESEAHAQIAEALLEELRNGTSRHGPYAPSAVTKAQAATAHLMLAAWHDRRGLS